MIDYYEPNIDLTLLGCGFLGGYHLGAVYLLSQVWPQKPYNRICGASCGGLLAALLVVGVRLDRALGLAMAIIGQLHECLMRPGKMIPVKDLVESGLEKLLPSDAHKLCNGRLGVSLTKLWSFENVFVSQFANRHELIEAISAGCFIPLWSGSLGLPKYRGEKCIDGAYSNNAPAFQLSDQDKLKGTLQVAVTPFVGQVQVSPEPEPSGRSGGFFQIMGTKYMLSWDNFIRSGHAMIPFPKRTYLPYIIGGHKDMKNYLLNSGLLKCRQCYSSQPMVGSDKAAAGAPGDGRDAGNAAEKRHERGSTGAAGKQRYSDTSAEAQPVKKKDNPPCLLCLRLLERVDSLKISQELIKIALGH